MDHHCPWVANCIGFYNYKYFLNMLFYASASCIFIFSTSVDLIRTLLRAPNDEDIVADARIAYFIVTAFMLSCIFGAIITGFFIFHIWLIIKQFTTIEFCEKFGSDDKFKTGSPYDLGMAKNFKTLLGENVFLWFLPVKRNLKGKGLFFEVREDLKQQFKNENKIDWSFVKYT